MTFSDYKVVSGAIGGLESDKDENGKIIRGSKQPKVEDYLLSIDYLTPDQKTFLRVKEYSSYANDDGTWKNSVYSLPWYN